MPPRAPAPGPVSAAPLAAISSIPDTYYRPAAPDPHTQAQELAAALGQFGGGTFKFGQELFKKDAAKAYAQGQRDRLEGKIRDNISAVEAAGKLPWGLSNWYIAGAEITDARQRVGQYHLEASAAIQQSGILDRGDATAEQLDSVLDPIRRKYLAFGSSSGGEWLDTYLRGVTEQDDRFRQQFAEGTRRSRVRDTYDATANLARQEIVAAIAAGDPAASSEQVRQKMSHYNLTVPRTDLNKIVTEAHVDLYRLYRLENDPASQDLSRAIRSSLDTYRSGTDLLIGTSQGIDALNVIRSIDQQANSMEDRWLAQRRQSFEEQIEDKRAQGLSELELSKWAIAEARERDLQLSAAQIRNFIRDDVSSELTLKSLEARPAIDRLFAAIHDPNKDKTALYNEYLEYYDQMTREERRDWRAEFQQYGTLAEDFGNNRTIAEVYEGLRNGSRSFANIALVKEQIDFGLFDVELPGLDNSRALEAQLLIATGTDRLAAAAVPQFNRKLGSLLGQRRLGDVPRDELPGLIEQASSETQAWMEANAHRYIDVANLKPIYEERRAAQERLHSQATPKPDADALKIDAAKAFKKLPSDGSVSPVDSKGLLLSGVAYDEPLAKVISNRIDVLSAKEFKARQHMVEASKRGRYAAGPFEAEHRNIRSELSHLRLIQNLGPAGYYHNLISEASATVPAVINGHKVRLPTPEAEKKIKAAESFLRTYGREILPVRSSSELQKAFEEAKSLQGPLGPFLSRLPETKRPEALAKITQDMYLLLSLTSTGQENEGNVKPQ